MYTLPPYEDPVCVSAALPQPATTLPSESNSTIGGEGIAEAEASFPLIAPDSFPWSTPLMVTPTSQARLTVKTLSSWSTQVPATSPCTHACATPSPPTGAGSAFGQVGSTTNCGDNSLLACTVASGFQTPVAKSNANATTLP